MLQQVSSSISPMLVFASGLIFVAAALHDVASRTLPNGMAVALALVGLLARLLDRTLILGVICGFVVFAGAAFCWRRGWMGGGDVKLIGAAGIAVPPHLVLSFLVVMSLSGAGLAVVYLIGRSLPAPRSGARPGTLLRRILRVERWRLHRGGPLPYACAIAAGGVFVLFMNGGVR